MSYTIRVATQADQTFLREMLHDALFVPPGHEPLQRSVVNQPDIAHYADGFGTRPGDVGLIAEDA
ncbi:MAG: histone acetyltransferase, partial [Actinobacteria bacterium]|nr:histone acetyltransferase [Actinomycetota bacterium]